jgi:hypothetical protein
VIRHSLPLLLALLAPLVVGCQRPYPLDERWRPLVEVVERPDLLVSNTLTTTLGTRLYVADLRAWLRRYPPGSVEQDALLLHEREHARRQLALGLGPWLARYLNDRGFMWREEQVGWALQLAHLRDRGGPLVPEALAATLAAYHNLAGPMVGYSEALAFVLAVLRGTWSPEDARG